MTDTPETPAEERKKADKKTEYIHKMIAYLTFPTMNYHSRGERIYIDTRGKLKGTKLLNVQSPEFRSVLLRLAKRMDNLLLRKADVELIIEHVFYHAQEVAKPLSTDARAMQKDNLYLINPGWENDKLIAIEPGKPWKEIEQKEWLFEPLPPKYRMPVPEPREATTFPEYLKRGIADFGDWHCLLSVTCATMLLPGDFVHPFIVFTGNQARGKSTTMKLIVQLVDPYERGELMSVGEDIRDIIALARGRHSIALDNVSKLPFDEDMLSKMYSGGVFATRKMASNGELSETETPRLRVLLNGIGNAFSRSDLMSRCIFIEHPALVTIGKDGAEDFAPLSVVEDRWKAILPDALGSLLAALSAGLKIFQENGGLKDKTSHSRFVEYCVIGECIAEAMGYEKGLFTKQVDAASEMQKESAIEADDTAQLAVAWLGGERAQVDTGSNEDLFASSTSKYPTEGEIEISASSLFAEIRALAAKRGYSVYSLKWLASAKSFTAAMSRSRKSIEHGGWVWRRREGGPKNQWYIFHKR